MNETVAQKPDLLPILGVLLAAALFGASAPLAKLLLGSVEPIPLASFLYLGSGVAASFALVLRRLFAAKAQVEAPLRLKDVPWLSGAVLAGGVAAPIALLFGLKATPAATASLLLNFEAVATTLIAVIFFRESGGARTWAAVGAITAASILLSLKWGGSWGFSLGALGVLGACVLWGADNNFTRVISGKDPFAIVAIKGFAAGGFSLVLAIVLGQKLPSLGLIGLCLAVGCVSYGASIVLFVLAMRSMGAARSSAFFATAPFFGVLISFIFFKETLTWQFAVSALLMALGAWLLLAERHAHLHSHEALVHEHRHRHDDPHHAHSDKETGQGGSHSHPHEHEPLTHSHPHKPDLHHRHEHDKCNGDS